MKRTKMKRILPLLLSSALLLGCVTTAFAADIDLGASTIDSQGFTSGVASNGNTNAGGTWGVDVSGNISVSDANNTITGSGTGSVTFTDPNASVSVQGDVTVGGIDATGDLTITGGAGDTLTSNGGGNTAGIRTGDDLTIDGGVTVNATGGSDGTGASNGVTVGGGLNVNNGVLTATGGGSMDGLSVTKDIYVGGIQDATDYSTKNSVTLSALTKLISPPKPVDPRIQPVITVTQTPQFAVVGQEMTIAITITPFDWTNVTAKYITIQFVDASGKVLHTIDNVPITYATDNSGVAQITYIHTMPHTSLTIKANFAGDDLNKPASGSTTTIVSAAPVI